MPAVLLPILSEKVKTETVRVCTAIFSKNNQTMRSSSHGCHYRTSEEILFIFSTCRLTTPPGNWSMSSFLVLSAIRSFHHQQDRLQWQTKHDRNVQRYPCLFLRYLAWNQTSLMTKCTSRYVATAEMMHSYSVKPKQCLQSGMKLNTSMFSSDNKKLKLI